MYKRQPYTAHVAPSVVKTQFGDYVLAFRLSGASFESSDDAQINVWHERLNVLWRNIAGPNVALWSHVIRRRECTSHCAARNPGPTDFATQLHLKYERRLARETLMVNELYLAIVHRPNANVTTGILSKALSRSQKDGSRLEIADALDVCAKLAQTVSASLARYEPELLGAYRAGQAWCSSLLEYLGVLVNGEWQRMPLPRIPLSQALVSTRLFFGNEAIEYRTATATHVGAMLGIKEYPSPSFAGMYDSLLSAPLAFVLTQSFSFLTKSRCV